MFGTRREQCTFSVAKSLLAGSSVKLAEIVTGRRKLGIKVSTFFGARAAELLTLFFSGNSIRCWKSRLPWCVTEIQKLYGALVFTEIPR